MNNQSRASKRFSLSINLASYVHTKSNPPDFSGSDIYFPVIGIKMFLHLIPTIKIFNVNHTRSLQVYRPLTRSVDALRRWCNHTIRIMYLKSTSSRPKKSLHSFFVPGRGLGHGFSRCRSRPATPPRCLAVLGEACSGFRVLTRAKQLARFPDPLKICMRRFFVCRGEDSNLHQLPDVLLRHARLPISPPRQGILKVYSDIAKLQSICLCLHTSTLADRELRSAGYEAPRRLAGERSSAPSWIRTNDQSLKRRVLYQTELWAHIGM